MTKKIVCDVAEKTTGTPTLQSKYYEGYVTVYDENGKMLSVQYSGIARQVWSEAMRDARDTFGKTIVNALSGLSKIKHH